MKTRKQIAIEKGKISGKQAQLKNVPVEELSSNMQVQLKDVPPDHACSVPSEVLLTSGNQVQLKDVPARHACFVVSEVPSSTDNQMQLKNVPPEHACLANEGYIEKVFYFRKSNAIMTSLFCFVGYFSG